MQNTIGMLNQQLSQNSFGLIVYRGRVTSLGKKPASELKYSKNGYPVWNGNVCYEKIIQQKNGKTRTIKKIKPFVAFGDIATDLGSLQEGNEVAFIAEDSNSKGQDGKWYDNAVVLAFDLLG